MTASAEGLVGSTGTRTGVASWITSNGLVRAGDIAVMAGSLAAGLGNSASDIDVYIVRAGEAGPLEGQQFFVAGRRVDCHDLAEAALAESVEQLESAVARGEQPPDSLVTLVYRVTGGVPLTTRTIPEDLRSRGEAAVRVALISLAAGRVSELWRAITVATALDDFDSAQTASVELVEAALYGALAHAGSTYPNVKWNWEKLAGLREAMPIRQRVHRLHAELSGAWPSLPDPTTTAEVLRELGLPVTLAVATPYPRRVDDLRSYELAGGHFLVHDGRVFGASAAAVHLITLADGRRGLPDLLDELHTWYGTAPTRLDEDACRAIRHLRMYELITVADEPSPATAPPPEVPRAGGLFEPTANPLGTVAEFLGNRFGVWLNWLDYLSRRDDLDGAAKAGQLGAAATAAREMVRHLARIHCFDRGVGPTDGHEVAMVQYLLGEESSLARGLTELARTTPARPLDLDDLAVRLDAYETALLDDHLLILDGSLREEDGHGQLFTHLRQVLDFADDVGVALPVTPMMLEKSRRYGAPNATA